LNVNNVVNDMDKILRRVIGENIELISSLRASPAVVKADASQMEQVILNLVINARDAMPGGGRLTIETRNVDRAEVHEAVKTEVRAGRYVMLSVTDTGCGIPPDILHLIFEPFFTTKDPGKGTGLGLATVYGIINQSGSYMAVNSSVGRGTSFRIFLPLVDADVYRPRTRLPVRVGAAGQTLLLVEDDDSVRSLASAILTSSGYHVLEARGGEEALRISREHQGVIHALITDVIMPQISGPQLASIIQGRRPDIKVLYMSGYTDEMISRHAGLDPGEAFVQKPFSPETLSGKVHEILGT
jgi:CheY-like chemotaxis protein